VSQRHRIRLSAEEIRSYLAEGHTMILVSNGKDGHPHPTPMFYALGASPGDGTAPYPIPTAEGVLLRHSRSWLPISRYASPPTARARRCATSSAIHG